MMGHLRYDRLVRGKAVCNRDRNDVLGATHGTRGCSVYPKGEQMSTHRDGGKPQFRVVAKWSESCNEPVIHIRKGRHAMIVGLDDLPNLIEQISSAYEGAKNLERIHQQ